MAGEKILIVEDDKHISRLLKYNLDKAGFKSTAVITGEEAIDILDSKQIDLIVLDIMLPKMDGFEVCRIIKQDKKLSHIPVIILTAKGEEVDRVVGFELGADDYVVKPFSPRELILRIKAVLKRGKPKEDIKGVLEYMEVKLDIPRHKVFINEKEIILTQMEFKLLTILMHNAGKVQSRDKLLDEAWDMASDVTTRTIDTHVRRLRQKLGQAAKYIETVRGIGYRFSEEK